jgi:putative ABC transport system permease protein
VRCRDILGLSLSALAQQRARTLFTLLGVTFSAFVLAASLAIGQGVQDAIESYVQQNEIIRRVEVTPQWDRATLNEETINATAVTGEMSDARRKRLQRAAAQFAASSKGIESRVRITPDVLDKLRALPHVDSVVPITWLSGFAVLGGESQAVGFNAARPGDEALAKRLVAGRLFEKPDEPTAIVSEFLLYRLGIRDEAQTQAVLGQRLRFEFRPQWGSKGFVVMLSRPQGGEFTLEEAAALQKLRRQLPAALDKLDLDPREREVLRNAVGDKPTTQPLVHAREFTIVGVVRAATEEEEQAPWDAFRVNSDVVLPFTTAVDFYFTTPGGRSDGINRAVVVADRDENVKAVADAARALGLNSYALVEFIQRQRLMFLLIFGGMTCGAAVAMIVAAMGITNTMLISVLERTREIGIMKALGARSGHLQLIFLIEGALIGLVGGTIGLLLAWAASFPGDAWVRQIATRHLETKIIGSIFVFPAWLQIAVVGSATVVTILAAAYPARRAARLDPVTALRHE